jgi:hypothetical protein
MNFKIEPEFQDLIPPMTPEEFEMLEKSIIKNGCHEPLIVWAGENILLDGHNRFKICLENKIEYKVVKREFDDENAAKNWMLMNQLGRRNLSPDNLTILRGQLYKLGKGGQGGDKKSKGKICTLINTASEIAEKTGVSERTIKNDLKFVDAVDKLKDKIDPDFKKNIQEGKRENTKAEIIHAAAVVDDDPQEAERILSGETVCSQLNAIEDKLTENSGVKVCLAFFMETSSLAQKAFAPRILKTINADGKKIVLKNFTQWIFEMEKIQDLFLKTVKGEIEK